MVFKNIIFLILILISTSGCALWPYKKDFDCPVQEGIKCKSLYEISEMADRGMFGPDAKKDKIKNELIMTKKTKNINIKRENRVYVCKKCSS